MERNSLSPLQGLLDEGGPLTQGCASLALGFVLLAFQARRTPCSGVQKRIASIRPKMDPKDVGNGQALAHHFQRLVRISPPGMARNGGTIDGPRPILRLDPWWLRQDAPYSESLFPSCLTVLVAQLMVLFELVRGPLDLKRVSVPHCGCFQNLVKTAQIPRKTIHPH